MTSSDVMVVARVVVVMLIEWMVVGMCMRVGVAVCIWIRWMPVIVGGWVVVRLFGGVLMLVGVLDVEFAVAMTVSVTDDGCHAVRVSARSVDSCQSSQICHGAASSIGT